MVPQKLENVVSQIQVNILLEYMQAPPVQDVKSTERVVPYIEVLRIINGEFDEHYATDLPSYKKLAKEPNFVGRLPFRE